MGLNQTIQADLIFSEVRKLVKKHGLDKAIVILKSFNTNRDKRQLDIYQYIINTVCAAWKISENDLFNGNNCPDNTEARRTTYVLMRKYMGFNNVAIAHSFEKDEGTIRKAIQLYDGMSKDRKFYQPYLSKHEEAEIKVSKFLNNILSNNNGK